MFKEKALNVLLFCSILTVCTAVLQFIYPDIGFLYGGFVAATLLTVFLQNDNLTKLFGIVSLALILLSGFYPREAGSTQLLLLQLLFQCIIVLLTMIAVIYIKKIYGSLENDQQQVKALFDNATEGIILTNQKGEIVLVNPAALQLFGYHKDELLGKAIEMLIPGRFHHAHSGYREGFYKKPGNRSMGHGRDLFAKTKTGEEFPVEVSLSFYKQKNEFFVIAFIVDITQRKESEQRLMEKREQLEHVTEEIRTLNADLENKVEERTMILKDALQELERSQQNLSEALDKEKELNEIKSRFVSMASHEFRTPLSTVLSSAALIGKYTQSDDQDKRDRHLKRIRDSVKHLNDLLEDFLSLGKLEEGKVLTTTGPVDLKEFLEDIMEEMKTLLKPGQEINISCSGDDLIVTDKKLLRNILINLIGNAAKFSPEGSPIQVSASNENDLLHLSVQDKGIGIAEEDQHHMFTSFFRGRNAVNIQGTGLGLHIVKRYVDLIQGKISLESKLGEGTTVTVELPDLSAKQ
ncbi:PAS domain-containing sensor histidine kinase [Pseudobacter ginsenosidimutans]|uniref:histidine kinase n=1 Tax=Pseudobacter ginsenosidimutans TaxID=661488 RepID=A0A4Q7MLR3_9BACT|nr:PAS domain-containing sensor histidine kinase [Pseudobacter ginsenosidimutans]RZS69325.1 PAS domain S-box-containing protein [Pseudobacter ginsenosidimutans]